MSVSEDISSTVSRQPAADVGAAESPPGGTWGRLLTGILYGLVVALTAASLLPVPSEAAGGMALVLMLVLIALSIPVGIAIITSALVGLFAVAGWTGVSSTLQTSMFQASASWSLAVLPMFILMGLLLWRAGATERFYTAAQAWLSWLPGGLAFTTNTAGAGLAAVSGSTLGITHAVARIGIPEMLRAGYDRRLATGSVIMAGTGGQLIPPSITLVIYAGIAGVPVGPQLMAGFVPGLLLVSLYGASIVAVATIWRHLAPRQPGTQKAAGPGRLKATLRIWPLPALAFVVLGGLFGGVFTATEAGAWGAFGAMLIAAVYLGVRGWIDAVRKALGETLTATAGIMLLLIGASLLSRMLALSGVARWFSQVLSQVELGVIPFLLLLAVCYLLLGFVIDPLTMILVTVPLLLPVVEAMGVSPMWFGVFVVLLGELAVITPPVGLLSFVVHRVAQDPEVNLGQRVSLSDVFTGVLWFLPTALLVVALLILFPEIVTWLPELTGR